MNVREELIKEASRLTREARKRWNAHENNQSCRQARDRALAVYEKLSKKERNELPEVLRVWLRYRSEKYFGKGRNGNGMSSKSSKDKKKEAAPNHAVAARKIMSGVGPLYILSSKRGICGLFFGHRVEPSTLPKDNSRDRFLNQAEKELGEYFEGDREIFEVVIDARGSQFQRLVWRQLSAIPFGETRGYGEIAEKGGKSQSGSCCRHCKCSKPGFNYCSVPSSDRERRRVDWFWRRFGNQEEALATRGGSAGGDVGTKGRSHWIERSHKFFG
jgi:hypothetical protein